MPRHLHRTTRRLSLQVLDDRRVLAALVGSVFHDANDSLRRDSEEVGLEKRLVYVDQNDNSKMDQGEPFALTGPGGSFSIDNLPDGDYAVRLFSGTNSQVQTTPSSAILLHDAVMRTDVTAAVPAIKLDAGTDSERTAPAVLASGASLQTIAADGTLSEPYDVGGEITQIVRLADGSLVVFANTSDGGQAWILDDALAGSAALGATGSESAVHSAGGDDLGRGVMVAGLSDSEEQGELWAFDAAGGTISATGVIVGSDAVVTGDSTPRSDDGPTRSVISEASVVDDGEGGMTQSLAISFWSNSAASMLGEPIVVSGASEVVAFSDQAGLLVLRTGDNLSVYDVDNNLAMLYSVDDTEPVAAIDANRGLLVTRSPRSFDDDGSTLDSGLRLIDSETGAVFADLPIDLSALDDLHSLALDDSMRSVVLTGAAGLVQLSLRKPAAARVTVAGGQAEPVAFGVQLIGSNDAPAYAETPVISGAEDTVFSVPLPSATDGDDELIILPLYPPEFGVATIGPDGQIEYTPDENFEGTDSLWVLVGDGRDFTETPVTINVTPVPDVPSGVTAGIDPVPENLPPGIAGGSSPIGIVGVIDVDAVNHFGVQILDLNRVPDERFQVVDLKIYFVGPEPLDAETEWLIPLIVSVDDPDSGGKLEFLTAISVLDEDDPITDITPDDATVNENSPGESITALGVIDQDVGQSHDLSVDDDRFEIVNRGLKLKDGVALDYEATQTVTVNVTAEHDEDSFTKAITITVLDQAETPENLELSNQTVNELEVAAVVGELTVDGNPAANGHSLTVNDARFVIEGSTLRLADNTFIERTPGLDDEILVEITATPITGGADGVTEEFVIAVVGHATPFHNGSYPEDVNRDEGVTAVDALAIINYLNAYGAGPVGEGDPSYGYDVNSDGFVTSLDALLVINELNAISTSTTGTVGNEPSGEPDAGSGNSKASKRIAKESDVPVPLQAPPISPRQRAIPQDFAIASLVDAISAKAVDSSAQESIDEAVAVISVDTPRMRDDATRADEVFGESEIDLLG